MQKILDYLHTQHDQPVTLNELAQVAGYSPFYFQRLCQQQLGIGPGKLHELIRLQRGYYLLMYRKWLSITDIALECGYQSPDGFSRAFKRVTGVSPGQFKTQSLAAPAPLQSYIQRWQQDVPTMTSSNAFHQQVSIVSLSPIKVCALRHTGHPGRLQGSIQRFISWRRANKLPPATYRTFNFWHNDPHSVNPADFCFDVVCERPARAVELDEDMRFDVIPAGRYARLNVVGGERAVEAAANYITSDYLTETNQQSGDFPLIVERVSVYPDVPYHQAQCHIFLLLHK
ncbi:AraC family transcriptional regulator [Alteromonas gilva]|uniref:AraC family transcriptional regulator n=1 Tax=Alteromonas gilva TaxID=2987522 RepID=A0ABT5L3N7_9ALTE|nr:GyrI-like domain-containing protein [Alteromonas gilva]MDC8831116.1 AraC family transcriptional regulator [Alteromonas gilva]